jgi:hypothetical protein
MTNPGQHFLDCSSISIQKSDKRMHRISSESQHRRTEIVGVIIYALG